MTYYVLDTDHLSILQRRAEPALNLKSQKLRMGTLDLRIASIALSQNAVLLTRNLSDFEKVPNLKVEDWTI